MEKHDTELHNAYPKRTVCGKPTHLTLDTKDGIQLVEPNDWIVKSRDGFYVVRVTTS